MVCSHGRPIGVTDLDFFHMRGLARGGWFHPNTEGETVMPLVGSMHRALRACASRNLVGEEGTSLVQPELIGSTVFADIEHALKRLESLALTLHREDGSLVPTELIGLQDCEELLAEGCLVETWFEDSDADSNDWLDELEQSSGLGPEEALADFRAPDLVEHWLPDIDPEHPRYQIIVTLIDDAIP